MTLQTDHSEYLEISRLNNELVNIHRELAKRNAELERLKAGLEALVVERTTALLHTNEQLLSELFEHKKAEEALRATTIQLRTLIQVSPLAIIILDLSGLVQLWNPAAEKIFGWREEEVLGQSNPIVPEEKQAEYNDLSRKVTQGDTLVEREILRRRKDGVLVTLSISSALLYDSEENAVGRMAIFADITERKRAEIALRESEEKFRSVITNLSDGIRLIDSQGIICEWNRALEEITGQTREETLGKPFAEVVVRNIPDELCSPDQLDKLRSAVQSNLLSIQQGAPSSNWVYTIQRRDGSRRQIQTDISRIATSRGVMLCGVVHDVTELKNREMELDLSHRELAQSYDLTLEGWARALEIREKETAGHSKRVADLACLLAQEIGMKDEDLVHMRRGSILHDIGKIGIPDKILLKAGALTDEEWLEMRKHPLYALKLIENIPYLQPALDIPCYHHEKWDGTGYPKGLKGSQIPLAARVFAFADVYDALVSERSYRKAWSQQKTLDYIRDQAGSHFDPDLVEPFLRLTQKFKE